MVTEEIENLQTDGISRNDRMKLADQIKSLGCRILVVGIDYGGHKNFRETEPHLRENGVDYTYGGTILPHFKLSQDRERRHILPKYSRIDFDGSPTLLMYDDWS